MILLAFTDLICLLSAHSETQNVTGLFEGLPTEQTFGITYRSYLQKLGVKEVK